MGLQFRRRIPIGKRAWLNVSTRGISASARLGRVTVNTHRRVSVRIARGLSWRKS